MSNKRCEGFEETLIDPLPKLPLHDPRVLALAAAIVALLDAVATRAQAPTSDDLIPLTAEGLAAHRFEHKPVLRLAESGQLRTVRIGRRRYTRPSWLAEVAAGLPAGRRTSPSAAERKAALLEELRGPRKRTSLGSPAQ